MGSAGCEGGLIGGGGDEDGGGGERDSGTRPGPDAGGGGGMDSGSPAEDAGPPPVDAGPSCDAAELFLRRLALSGHVQFYLQCRRRGLLSKVVTVEEIE